MLPATAMVMMVAMVTRGGVIGLGNNIASSMANFMIGRSQLILINCSGIRCGTDGQQGY
jgi:hypothetical protein